MNMRLPVTLGVVLLLTSSAFAQKAATSSEVSASSNKQIAGRDGEKAAAEDKSDKLRAPTAEETKVLLDGVKELVNDSAEGLTVVKEPDGSLSLDHQGRFQNVTIAKMNRDGSVSTECVTNAEQARRFLEHSRLKAAAGATTPTNANQSASSKDTKTKKLAKQPVPEVR
jgi:hypothetical protein